MVDRGLPTLGIVPQHMPHSAPQPVTCHSTSCISGTDGPVPGVVLGTGKEKEIQFVPPKHFISHGKTTIRARES